MINHSSKKARLIRIFAIVGLILPALSPVSARALTEGQIKHNSVDSAPAAVGEAKGIASRIGHNSSRLSPFSGLLPPGTPFLPSLLVNTIDTSTWTHPSTDPAGIAYWSLTGKLLVSDTEIEEAPAPFWDGFNIFQSTLAGSLSSNCTTFTSLPTNPTSYNNFSDEPAGVTINTSNNHFFFSDDGAKKIFELAPGLDGNYCTSDDIVSSVAIGVPPYSVNDPEDVAYGQGKLYIAGGMDGEVYEYDLGANGILGGGDDSPGPLSQFDTDALGFSDVEGIAYNAADGTLYIVSTADSDTYLGEASTSGTLLRAYDLSYLGGVRRSGLTVAPASGDPSTNNIYIVSRGVDNFVDPNNNDGKIWEIDISNPNMPDLIFKDGFESGDFSAWTKSSTNGGNLSADPSAALDGSYGMRAVIASTAGMNVTDESPTLESRYRARFYFDPNSIAMASGDLHEIFQGDVYSPTTGAYISVLQVQFRYSGGVYQIRGRSLDDTGTCPSGGWCSTSWYTITDASHCIELDWFAASTSGANNGYLAFWIDGMAQSNGVTNLDNDTRRIDRARLGPISGLDAGTSGTDYFDAFESRRNSYIGPINSPPTVLSVVRASVNPTSAASVNYTVTFSEPVTGVNGPDFTLTTTGVNGATVGGVSGTGAIYTVTVNTGTGNGTIRLDILDDNSIVDSENTPLNGGFTNGQVYTVIKGAEVKVDIAGNNVGNYYIPFQGSQRVTYDLDSGPVKVESTNNIPIIAALRDAWLVNGQVTSFAQLMGLPEEQLSDTYYFPAYNNVTVSEQIRIGNVDNAATDVTVTIGGSVPTGGVQHLEPNQGVRLTFPLDTGPVEVKSSGGVKIIAAIRSAWLQNGQAVSFTQLMGLPKEALSDTYYLPAYNNVTLSGQLRIGNVGSGPTDVTVKIAGVEPPGGPYHLNVNESVRLTYALDTGPVEVKSSGGVKIIAALRDAWLVNNQVKSFAQLMGLPKEKLSDTYLFPAYNNVTLSGQLRFGNVDTTATDVTVTIGGVAQGTYPLNPSESTRQTYPLDTGPVEIKSSSGVKIIAALRDAWLVNGQATSFVQLMGLPIEQLSTSYWFPAYNNLTLSGQLRFGVP